MDFASMKRRDLQALCKRHGLPGGGTNADLVARLAAALPGCGGAEEQAVEVLAGKGCLKRLTGGSSGGGSDASKKVTFVLEEEAEVEVEDRIRGRRRTRGEQKSSVTLPGAEVGGVERRRTRAQAGVGSVDGSDAGEVDTDAPVRRSRRNALNLDAGDGVEMVGGVVSQSNSAKTGEEDEEAGEVVDRKRKRKTRENDEGVDVSGQIEVSCRSTRSSGVPSEPATMSSPVVEKKRDRRKAGDVTKQTCAEEQTSEVQHLGRTRRSGSVVVGPVPPIISESKRSRRKLQEEETAVEKVAKVEISGRTTRSSSVAAAMTSPIVVEKKRVMRKAGDVTKQTCAEEQTSQVEQLGRTLRSGLVVAGPVSPIVSESKRSRRKLQKEEPDLKKVAKVEISGRTTRSGSVAAAVTSPIVVEKSRRKTEDLPAVVEKERKGLTKEVIPEAHVGQSTQKSAAPAMLEKQRKGISAGTNPDAHVIVRRSTRKSIVPSMLDNEINDHDKMRSAEVGGVEQPVRRLTRKSVVCPVIQKVAKVEISGRTTRSGSVAGAVTSPIVVEKRRRKAEDLPAVEKERKGLTKEVIPEAHVRQSTQKSAAPAMLEKQRKGIPAEMNPDALVIVRRSMRKSIVPSMLDNEINDNDKMRSAEVGGVKKQLGLEQPVRRLTRKSVAWPVFEKGNKGLHTEMKPEAPAKKSASNSVAPNAVDKMNNGHIIRTEESGVRTRNSQTRLQFAAQNDESLQGTTNKSSKLVVSNLQSKPTSSQGRPAKRMKTTVLHMPAEEPNVDDMVIREATQDGDKVTHEYSEVSIGWIQEIKQVDATVEEFPSASLIGTLLEDTHGVHSVNEEIHESESGLAKSSHEEQVASGSLVFLEAANCFEKTNSDEVACKDEENKKSVNYINSSCEQTEANGPGEHAYCISDTSLSSSLIAPANDNDELHHSSDLSRLESTDILDEPIACSNTEVPEQGFKEQREVLHMLVEEPNADGTVIREAMQDGVEVTREYTEVSNTCIQEIRQVNTIEEELLEDPHRVQSMNEEIHEPESGLTKSTHEEEQVASGPLVVLEAASCMETNNSEEVACKDEENKKRVNYINSSYEPTGANGHDFLGEPIGCTEVPQEDFKEKCGVLNMPVEEPNVDGTPIREETPDSDEVTQEYTEVPSSCIQDISQVNATGEEVPSALLLGTLLEDTRRAQSMNVEIHELESGLTKSHHEEEHVASGHPLVVLEAANCTEKTNSEEVDRKDEENKKPVNYIDSSCKPTNANGPAGHFGDTLLSSSLVAPANDNDELHRSLYMSRLESTDFLDEMIGCSNSEVPQPGIKEQCEVLHMLVEEPNADGTVIREAMQDGDEVTREYTEVSSSCIQETRQVNTLEEELLEDPHRVQDMNEEIHESESGLTKSTHEEEQVASGQVVVLEAANCMEKNNSEEVACKDEENKKPVNYINSSCEPTDAVGPGCTEVPQEDFKGKCEALDMPVEEPNADGTPIMEAMPDGDEVTQEYTEVPNNCIQQIGQVNATGEEVPSALLLGTLFEDTRRAQSMNVEIHESESELIKSHHEEEHVASGHLVVLEAANCTEKTNSEEVDCKDEENKKPVDYIYSSCKPTNADGPAEHLGDTLLSSSLVAPANDELYRNSDMSRLESTDFLDGLISCSNTEVPQQGIKEQCEVHKKEQVVYGAHSDLIEVAAVKDLESGMPPLPAVEKSNMRDEQPNSKLEGVEVKESGLSCDKSNINILDFGSALNCVVEKAPSGSSLSEDSAMDHLESSDLVAGGTIEKLPFDLAIPNYNVGASSEEVVHGLKNDAERCSPKSQAPTHWATFSTEKSFSMASGMSEAAMTEGSESGKALPDVQLNPKLEDDEFKEHNLNCGEESVYIFGAGSAKNGVSHLGKDSLTNSCQEQGEAPNDLSAPKSPEGCAIFQVECVIRSGICQTIGQRFTDETSTKDHREEHNGQNEDQVTTGILANGMSEPALFGGLDRVMLPTAETSALPDEKFNTKLEVDGEYSLICDKDSSNISDTGPVGDNNLSTLKDDPCHGMPAPKSPEESSIRLDDGFSASEGICQTSGRRRVDEISTKLLTFKISSTVKGSYIAMDASGCAKQGDNLSQSAIAFLGNSENTLAAETDPPNLNTDHSVSKDSSTQMLQGISGGLSDVVLAADNPDNRLTVEQVQQDDAQVQEGILDKTLLGSATPECKHDCGLLDEEVLQSTGNDRCSSSVGQPPFGLQSLFSHENVEEPMEYDANDVGLAADHPAIKLAVELVQQDGVQVQEGTLEKTALGSATPECKHESRLTEEVELQSMKNERCSSRAEQSPFGLQSLFSQESIEEPVRYDALSLARVKGESGGSKDEYKVENSPLPEPSSDHGTQVDLRVVSKAGDCVYTSQQDDEKEGLTKPSHEQEQVAPGQLDFLDAANNMEKYVNSEEVSDIRDALLNRSLVAPTMGNDGILPSHSLHQLESTDFMDEPIGCSNAEVLQNPRPNEESDENKTRMLKNLIGDLESGLP